MLAYGHKLYVVLDVMSMMPYMPIKYFRHFLWRGDEEWCAVYTVCLWWS